MSLEWQPGKEKSIAHRQTTPMILIIAVSHLLPFADLIVAVPEKRVKTRATALAGIDPFNRQQGVNGPVASGS